MRFHVFHKETHALQALTNTFYDSSYSTNLIRRPNIQSKIIYVQNSLQQYITRITDSKAHSKCPLPILFSNISH